MPQVTVAQQGQVKNGTLWIKYWTNLWQNLLNVEIL